MTATLCVCACVLFQQAEADAQTFLTGIYKTGLIWLKFKLFCQFAAADF